MLLTLKHLLATLLLLSLGLFAGMAVIEGAGLGPGIAGLVVALSSSLVPLLLGWPIFRVLSLRPLILPMCAHSGRRHGNYHIARDAWPVAVLICIHCDRPTRLFLSPGAGFRPSVGMPAVTLRRPGFLGLWRAIPIEPVPQLLTPGSPSPPAPRR